MGLEDSDTGNTVLKHEEWKSGIPLEAEVEDYFQAAVIAYFRSLPVYAPAPGRDVIREVRFIAESMGFNLRCRTSIFVGRKTVKRDSGNLEDTQVLQKCILKRKNTIVRSRVDSPSL